MTTPSKQSGMVLVISLIMLVVLTLLAVAAVNMSTVNLHIVGNMQAKMDAESATELAINNVLGSLSYFQGTQATTTTVSGYTVQLSAPFCVSSAPAEGWQQQYSINPTSGVRYDSNWVIDAQVTSGSTAGETAHEVQGVQLQQMLTGCPTTASTNTSSY